MVIAAASQDKRPVRLSLPGWPPPTPLPWSCPGCLSVWLTADLGPRCPRCGFYDAS
jgi:hypothetical protein